MVSAFDPDRYFQEVLEPARRHDLRPVEIDLLLRYALAPELLEDRNRPAFDRRVAEVVNHWRTLGQRKTHASLASGLLAAHEALERAGDLEPHRLEQRRAAHVAEARKDVQQRALHWAASFSCVRPAIVEQLTAKLGGRLDQDAVRAEFESQDVRIAEPPELSRQPPTSRYGSLKQCLRLLDRRLSLEVVHGGPIPTGFRVLDVLVVPGMPTPVDGSRIAAVRQRLAAEPLSSSSTAAMTVLEIIELENATRGGLDRLVRWEVIETLRSLASEGYPQRALAAEAVALGLAPEEADRLALAVHLERPSGQQTAVEAIEEALAAGRLRSAERLLSAVPTGQAGDLHQRLMAEVKLVAEIVGKAERARAEGRTETAAELFAEALLHAGDDEDLQERLRGLPPPAPGGVQAVVAGSAVTIRWQPSPSRAGGVRYRVTRAIGGGRAGTRQRRELGETDANEWYDEDPPTGEPLRYCLAASRAHGVWSAEALAGAIVVTPEVVEPRLLVSERAVTGSWQVHPAVDEVVVVRSEGGPPQSIADGRRVRPVGRFGFTDREIQTDVRYYYRVAAVYVSGDGTRFPSAGVVRSAVPTPPPDPVLDLQASVVISDGWPSALELTWTAPANGSVMVLMSDDPSRWTPGTTLRGNDVKGFGRPLGIGADQLAAGRARLPLAADQRRCHLVPVTVLHTEAVVGNPVELAPVLPVRRLEALRRGNVVQLSWVWPDDCTSTRVRWWPLGSAPERGNEAECLRRIYQDHGGFDITVGPVAVMVSVQAVSVRPDGPAVSLAVTSEVPAREIQVWSSLRRQWERDGVRRTLAWVLDLSCDRPCTLPTLVVVQSAGAAMPLRVEQGRTVARVERRSLQPGKPLSVRLRLRPGPSWLACFPMPGTGHDAVVLVPPALRIR
jgi:hypothetical protein